MNQANCGKEVGMVTALVQASRDGDVASRDQLFNLVYNDLKQIAKRSPYVARDGQTMQATAVANEACIKLMRRIPAPPPGQPENRGFFFKTVAMAMRTILRDYWKQQTAEKRGGKDGMMVDLGDALPEVSADEKLTVPDFLALDDALDRLERFNARWHEVVLHRYFASRTIEETADMMNYGIDTIKTDWRAARAWLRRELE
jgi:RNA polymerase sigma factor (TIGR02999 family)